MGTDSDQRGLPSAEPASKDREIFQLGPPPLPGGLFHTQAWRLTEGHLGVWPESPMGVSPNLP